MQDIDYVLDFAVRLGKEMLVSGANLERVNIATELVCKHYGLNELTIRVMNTEVAVGAKNQAGDYCTRRINVPAQLTGYEYQVESCLRALEKGEIECPEMPHSESIMIMEIMDALRAQWGVKYPFED